MKTKRRQQVRFLRMTKTKNVAEQVRTAALFYVLLHVPSKVIPCFHDNEVLVSGNDSRRNLFSCFLPSHDGFILLRQGKLAEADFTVI